MPSSQRNEPRRRVAEPGRRVARRRATKRLTRVAILIGAVSITTVAAAGAIGAASTSAPRALASANEHTASSQSTDLWAPLVAGLDRVRELSSAQVPVPDPAATATPTSMALPAGSGSGERVVFDMSEQRVWLVSSHDTVRRTYPVSGSRQDNLHAGRYRVYSRSLHATGFDLTSTMDYFVRFTRGKNAAIGFHDIPVDREGKLVQSSSELGSPTSSGCIRQQRADAKALWAFAPVRTKVVVLA